MASDIHSRAQRIGFLKQSAWASPQAASANFQTLNYDAGVSVPKPGVTVNDFDFTSSGSLMKEESRIFVDGVSGLSTIPFKGVATKSLLAAHLIAAFQKVTEGASTPYTKDISPANAVIDFAADAGYTWTVAADSGNTDGAILECAILNRFQFSVNPNGNGIAKLAMIEGDWVGNELNFAQTLNGTWVAMPTTGFFNTDSLGFTLDLVIGSTTLSAVCYRNFTMTLENNVFSDCKTTGGKANNYKLNPTLKYTIDIPYNSASKALMASFKAGDNCSVTFYNGAGTSDGEFKLTSTKGILTEQPQIFEGDYYAFRLNIESLKPTSGGYATTFLKYSDTVDGAY